MGRRAQDDSRYQLGTHTVETRVEGPGRDLSLDLAKWIRIRIRDPDLSNPFHYLGWFRAVDELVHPHWAEFQAQLHFPLRVGHVDNWPTLVLVRWSIDLGWNTNELDATEMGRESELEKFQMQLNAEQKIVHHQLD